MGKYEPLADYLRDLGKNRVQMKFDEIESVLGFPLPPSSRKHRAWWSNNPSNNVMTHAWIDAGYQTEDVDIEQCKLIFRRVTSDNADATSKDQSSHRVAGNAGTRRPRGLYGCLRGTVTIAVDVDLTEPADPDWAERAQGCATQ
ncbi:MAG TPA: hypothetical protein VMY41_05835 [Thermohalobaculum sp.]|nr:hypothetical protein [Thermohalobaculum sp.]